MNKGFPCVGSSTSTHFHLGRSQYRARHLPEPWWLWWWPLARAPWVQRLGWCPQPRAWDSRCRRTDASFGSWKIQRSLNDSFRTRALLYGKWSPDQRMWGDKYKSVPLIKFCTCSSPTPTGQVQFWLCYGFRRQTKAAVTHLCDPVGSRAL